MCTLAAIVKKSTLVSLSSDVNPLHPYPRQLIQPKWLPIFLFSQSFFIQCDRYRDFAIQELKFLYLLFRFRTNNKILKIRSVEAHDSGVYYCKGINGFGTAEVRIDLMVIGKG